MANHEDRPIRDKVHLFLAIKRKKFLGNDTNECIRVVINDYDLDLFLLEEKCKKLGGTWRIHHTANARDTEKARKWLIHRLIDNPTSFAGCIDSLWRTALLQPECKAENNFMFDIDTKDKQKINHLWEEFLLGNEKNLIETPSGWHIITKAFDTREICKLSYVTLIRDGYYFIKEIK
jgi:hypothetical protein